jgi:hypothetical protein
MFTAEQREQVRQRILEVAQSDPRVIAGALTGCLISELQARDPSLCARLSPLLHEFGAPQAQAGLPGSPNVPTEQEG